MRQQLAKIQFKKGMDPALIFEQLTSIQNQCLGPGKTLNKDKLIALILDITTDEYKATLTVERRQIDCRRFRVSDDGGIFVHK
jgi:hypothetical protein